MPTRSATSGCPSCGRATWCSRCSPCTPRSNTSGEGALRRALLVIQTARELAELHREDVAIVETGRELREVIASGRIALVLAFEGMEPVGGDLAVLDAFFRLGVRIASFTWNRRTAVRGRRRRERHRRPPHAPGGGRARPHGAHGHDPGRQPPLRSRAVARRGAGPEAVRGVALVVPGAHARTPATCPMTACARSPRVRRLHRHERVRRLPGGRATRPWTTSSATSATRWTSWAPTTWGWAWTSWRTSSR